MSSFSLSGSVGQGGRNDEEDVQAITDRLVELGFDWLATGPETEAARVAPVSLSPAVRVSAARAIRANVMRPTKTQRPGKHWLRPKWTIAALPRLVIQPTPPPSVAVRSGDYTLWPDSSANRAFFALAVPRVRSLSLTVQRQSVGGTIATTGGTLVLGLSVYDEDDLDAIEAHRQEWTDRIEQAGHPTRAWKFEALGLRRLEAKLHLPEGHAVREPVATANADSGQVTLLADLTELGTLTWKQALESGRADTIPGTCELLGRYLARSGSSVSVQPQVLNTGLGEILRQHGSEVVHVVDPQVSVAANVIVDGDPTLESVVVDWRPSGGGSPESQTFGSEGGRFSRTLTSYAPENIRIDWRALVRYQPPGWPVVDLSGRLSVADVNWSVLISPASWIRHYTLITMLLDERGDVVPVGSSEDIDPNHRVQGELTFTAPYLEAGRSLSAAFETSSQEIVEMAFPLPRGEAPGELELTLFALRGGIDSMTTRRIAPDESMIVAKVYPSARIEIVTNRDRAPETSLEGDLLGVLDRLRADGRG